MEIVVKIHQVNTVLDDVDVAIIVYCPRFDLPR